MEFAELMKMRQSVRRYTDQPVEGEKLVQLVEAVRMSPSASNSQPWTLIMVTEPELTNKVAEATYSRVVSFNKFVPQAPVIAVLVIERPRAITQLGAALKDRDFPLIDIGVAASHLCLQAAELGLGTCMLGWFDEKKVRSLLEIPKSKRIGLLISVGYPIEGYRTRPKIRKETAAMSRFEKY